MSTPAFVREGDDGGTKCYETVMLVLVEWTWDLGYGIVVGHGGHGNDDPITDSRIGSAGAPRPSLVGPLVA
jgi:hypothetical protein